MLGLTTTLHYVLHCIHVIFYFTIIFLILMFFASVHFLEGFSERNITRDRFRAPLDRLNSVSPSPGALFVQDVDTEQLELLHSAQKTVHPAQLQACYTNGSDMGNIHTSCI